MEKDLKEVTELTKKLSESQTLIYIGDKTFVLNEMSIKRVKDFAVKFVSAMDQFSKKTGVDVSQLEVQMIIGEYSEMIFAEITTLFNWVFEYKNEDFKAVTEEWMADNVSIRILTEIMKQIAVQNKLDWLGPFFKGKIQGALEVAMR